MKWYQIELRGGTVLRVEADNEEHAIERIKNETQYGTDVETAKVGIALDKATLFLGGHIVKTP